MQVVEEKKVGTINRKIAHRRHKRQGEAQTCRSRILHLGGGLKHIYRREVSSTLQHVRSRSRKKGGKLKIGEGI